MKKIIVWILAALLLLSPAAALASEALIAQGEALLKEMGFDSVEEALAAYEVETVEGLIMLVLTGKIELPEGVTLPAMPFSLPGMGGTPVPNPALPTSTPVPPELERTFDGKVLATMEMIASAEEIKYFFQESLGIPIKDFLTFPTASEALMALKAGKVDTVLSMDSTASYMAQQDPTLYTYMDPRLTDFAQISLSMVVMRKNEALGAQLNEAIQTLGANGTLLMLAGTMLGGEPPAAPEAELTGETLRVGVTGDIPPVDYVDASGQPAGYNVNLMAHIGALLGRPIEFVLVGKGAAITALATGRIDILFWQEQALSEDIQGMVGDMSENVFVTDPYLSVNVTAVELK